MSLLSYYSDRNSYHIDITEDLRKISNKEEDTTKPDRGDEMLIDMAPGARDRNVD